MKVQVKDAQGDLHEVDLPEDVTFGVQVEQDDILSVTFYAYSEELQDDVFQLSIEVEAKISQPHTWIHDEE